MLSLFVTTKKHEIDSKGILYNKEFLLPAFSVVIAEQGANVQINQADSNSISIEYIKNDKAPSKLYSIKDDTLHIYDGLKMFVKFKKINTVIGQNARWVEIIPFVTDSLTLKSRGGRLCLRNFALNKINERIQMSGIGITATDSAKVEISEANVRNMTVYSSNSEVRLYCKIRSLTSRIEHNARFTSDFTPEVIDVKRDSTCTVNIFGRR